MAQRRRYRRRERDDHPVLTDCWNCDTEYTTDEDRCPACGEPPRYELSPQERRERLREAIGAWVNAGYRVVSQTDYTAQLIKPKQFSMLWFLIWSLLIFPAVLYVLYHFGGEEG